MNKTGVVPDFPGPIDYIPSRLTKLDAFALGAMMALVQRANPGKKVGLAEARAHIADESYLIAEAMIKRGKK